MKSIVASTMKNIRRSDEYTRVIQYIREFFLNNNYIFSKFFP